MKHILLMFIYVLLLSSCSKEDSNIEVEPPTNMGLNIRFLSMLPLTLDMGEINGNEKYYDLPNPLPSAAIRPQTIHNGDIMLYGLRTFVLFYEIFSTSYSYTRIGRVNNPSELKVVLGRGNVTVRFELE